MRGGIYAWEVRVSTWRRGGLCRAAGRAQGQAKGVTSNLMRPRAIIRPACSRYRLSLSAHAGARASPEAAPSHSSKV